MLGTRDCVEAHSDDGLQLSPVTANAEAEFGWAIADSACNLQRAQIFALNFTGYKVDVGHSRISFTRGKACQRVCRVVYANGNDVGGFTLNPLRDGSVLDQRHPKTGQ